MNKRTLRVLQMFTLVVAGEMIFGLPYNIPRYFRPTMLEAFNFTNTQLGDVFAAYGVMAMLAYFPGGVLADRFSTRGLMTTSLIATAVGGLYMATFPNATQMALLYGYWGVTSVFLFWAALIRATREWGGRQSQGTAFGILDGGRGLMAAVFASFAVAVFSIYMPENVMLATDTERETGFRIVILLYSAITLAAGILTWLFIPDSRAPVEQRRNPLKGMAAVMRRPVIWAQAAVIVCAYCGYKGLDNYSLYAVQVLGKDEVEGARLAAYGSYIRPVAALVAGLLADRYTASRVIGWLFAFMLASFAVLNFVTPTGDGVLFLYSNIAVSFFAVYGLRGVYFALLEETSTPKYLTGTSVGMVSFVGYTPDIFFGPISGRILDASPGVVGHQHYYLFLACIAALGVVVVAGLLQLQRIAVRNELAKT
jgi:nitrate/nitrite transporter NarK